MRLRSKYNLAFSCFTVLVLSSCNKQEQVIGQWYNPISGQGVATGTALNVFYHKKEFDYNKNAAGVSQAITTVKNGFFSFEKPTSKKGFITITPAALDEAYVGFPIADTTFAVTALTDKIEFHFYRKKKGRILLKGIENYQSDEYRLNLDIYHDVFGEQGGVFRTSEFAAGTDEEQSLIELVEGKNTVQGSFTLNGQTININKEVNWSLEPGASDSIVINL